MDEPAGCGLSSKERIFKPLRYMHRNPVKPALVTLFDEAVT
jgi:hypothetical protein